MREDIGSLLLRGYRTRRLCYAYSTNTCRYKQRGLGYGEFEKVTERGSFSKKCLEEEREKQRGLIRVKVQEG